MIQNFEPILIAARGKTPTVPRRSLKSATPPLGSGGCEIAWEFPFDPTDLGLDWPPLKTAAQKFANLLFHEICVFTAVETRVHNGGAPVRATSYKFCSHLS